MSDRGVVYLFCGMGFAERMVVSLLSLRDHWKGPVTVGVTDDECQAIIDRIAGQLELQVLRVEKAPVRRHAAYRTKTQIPTWTPYEKTVFIDGDTVVVGSFDELFDAPLTITQFSDWQAKGRKISSRITRWQTLDHPAVTHWTELAMAARYPAINTGVFGFHRGNPYLGQWDSLCAAGAGLHMTDELAMQILYKLLPAGECVVVDDRFNCSPLYGVNRDDARIWHCHGSKHTCKEAGRKVWLPAFQRAVDANLGGLAEWAGEYDKRLRDWLNSQKEAVNG